jgi:hypothetical protein
MGIPNRCSVPLKFSTLIITSVNYSACIIVVAICFVLPCYQGSLLANYLISANNSRRLKQGVAPGESPVYSNREIEYSGLSFFLFIFSAKEADLMENKDKERKTLRLTELPEVYGMSMTFWRTQHYSGALRTYRAGKAILVRVSDLEKFLDSLPTNQDRDPNEQAAA